MPRGCRCAPGYRQIEFFLGNKNPACSRAARTHPEIPSRILRDANSLDAPSRLYDDGDPAAGAARFRHRRGRADCASIAWICEPHVANDSVTAWRRLDRSIATPRRYSASLYELAEKLLDLERLKFQPVAVSPPRDGETDFQIGFKRRHAAAPAGVGYLRAASTGLPVLSGIMRICAPRFDARSWRSRSGAIFCA